MAEARRKVGGFEVAPIGLGCMSLTHGYGPPPPADHAERLLNRALDIGYDFLDTATAYGDGRNEELIGRALKGRRHQFRLASKCGIWRDGNRRWIDCRPETVRASVDASLQRLGFDHIDIYYLHRRDPEVPIEDSVGELQRAVEAGKIGGIGLSEVSAETLRRAHAVHPITALQSEYSLWTRNPEIAVLAACRELGVSFAAFSPVGRGFLAGAVLRPEFEPGDMRSGMPRFNEPNLSPNLKLLDDLGVIADERGCTTAQLSLAWLLHKDDALVPIPGTTSIPHMEDNMQATSIALDDRVMERLDILFDHHNVRGNRYGAEMQASSETELFA